MPFTALVHLPSAFLPLRLKRRTWKSLKGAHFLDTDVNSFGKQVYYVHGRLYKHITSQQQPTSLNLFTPVQSSPGPVPFASSPFPPFLHFRHGPP